jgi:K+-sensing histidine kinase KdpD
MNPLQITALRAWCNASNEGLLVIDFSGTIILINAHLHQMLGLAKTPATVAELLEQTEAVTPELCALLALQENAEQAQWGNLAIRQFQQSRVSWKQFPLLENDMMVGSVTIFQDAAAHEQLELAKQSFLSMISHDLRTPLSTILGFAELLYHNRGNLSDEEQKEFLEHIIKNANDLTRYTQIAMDIMFLEANTQNFPTEPVQLERFVKHWLSDAFHRFPAERLMYHNGFPENKTTYIAPAALHKILYILVEFALAESSPEDQVSIQLNYEETLAHIVIQHKAPRLSAPDVTMLFQLMHVRDLSESGRPQLHRMQLYVASLLAQRQSGYLTLRGRDQNDYQIDLALPVSSINKLEA